MASSKYYVVWKGVKTGVFSNWNDCKAAVEGYANAQYKSFPSFEEAKVAFENGFTKSKTPVVKSSVKSNYILNSLSVDAACSGNPGVMEYQGVHVGTREVWFHQKFELGTNNIGEFLALVHGIAELKRRNLSIPIYTDSMTALAWLRHKKCKTKLEQSNQTTGLFNLVERAENWLKTNSFDTPILKWETEIWGEIPADFGRK